CRLGRAHQEPVARLRTERVRALAARRHHMNQDNMTTQLTGHLLIGHHEVAGAAHAYRGFDPSTGRELEPAFSAATPKPSRPRRPKMSAAPPCWRATPSTPIAPPRP